MKSKLIKLSDTHYIIVDDSEIKEGDWYYLPANKTIQKSDHNAEGKYYSGQKITHSTKPLEHIKIDTMYEGEGWSKIKQLSLSEVEEIIFGYSVENAAYHFCDNVIHPKDETRSLYFAFCTGFKIHQELVKDKLFTIDDMKKAIEIAQNSSYVSTQHFSGHSSVKHNFKLEEIIQSLLPKTEWNVEFVDGKIKLI